MRQDQRGSDVNPASVGITEQMHNDWFVLLSYAMWGVTVPAPYPCTGYRILLISVLKGSILLDTIP